MNNKTTKKEKDFEGDDVGLFVRLVNEKRKEKSEIRYVGKFHALINDLKKAANIDAVRGPSKTPIDLSFDDIAITYSFSKN